MTTIELPRSAASDVRDGARMASPTSRPGISTGAAADPAPVESIGHTLGPVDAPLALVVYGTYECLHCRRAWPALRALAEDGVARVTWRHFAPPGAFPNASAAASAAEAAAEQGAFWALHEALMVAPTPIWPESAVAHAVALGLDAARLAHDVADATVRARVARQTTEAVAHGVRGTPTVLQLVEGEAPARLDARDPDALAEALRESVQRTERSAQR